MPSLSLPNRLIWFAHCPKTGGTSVEEAMVAAWGDQVGHLHWGWDLWWRRGGWRTAKPPNSPQHLIWRDALEALPRAPDVVFALVRDPATRMESEHRYQRRLRRGTWAGRALAWLPFTIWLRLMLAVVVRHPYAYDNHLRPQSAFVPEGALVFRLEDGLEPVFDWLRDISNFKIVSDTEEFALRTIGQSRATPADRVRIAVVFAKDYARFGYPVPDLPPIRRGMLDRLTDALAPIVVWLDRRGCL